jgi:hypothetical protein
VDALTGVETLTSLESANGAVFGGSIGLIISESEASSSGIEFIRAIDDFSGLSTDLLFACRLSLRFGKGCCACISLRSWLVTGNSSLRVVSGL